MSGSSILIRQTDNQIGSDANRKSPKRERTIKTAASGARVHSSSEHFPFEGKEEGEISLQP